MRAAFLKMRKKWVLLVGGIEAGSSPVFGPVFACEGDDVVFAV